MRKYTLYLAFVIPGCAPLGAGPESIRTMVVMDSGLPPRGAPRNDDDFFLRNQSPMSLESVRAFFAGRAPDIAVIESEMSSATVALAALAYGVEPARIAKTLSLRVGDRVG